jgi:DNA-binding PadR family transcriptional regulator
LRRKATAQDYIIGFLSWGQPMSTKTIYDYIVNKDSSQQQERKYVVIDGKRFGYLEYLVLEFSSKHHLIQAAQVREYLKNEHGFEADLRRIHDSLQRLVRKGIVEKIGRGVYRLTDYGKKLLNTLLAKKTHKESEFKAAADGVVYADGDGGFGRYRFHALNARSLEDLVRQLYAMYRAVGCALRYLKQVLGKSRFYRIVRDVRVECIDYFVGGHGVGVIGKSKSLRRPLIDLSYFSSLGLKPKEIGIDVFTAVSGVGKVSLKAYFG